MTYLVKKLGHQGLGSITPSRPSPQRGRYLFVPKNSTYLQHLPHLSQTVLNDFQILTIVPLYKNSFERNYCTFVYNNDAYHGGGGINNGRGRDEYRIYSNQVLEDNQLLFQTHDILVLKPYSLEINADEINETEQVYFAYLVQAQNSTLYNYLSSEIENSNIRGNYAVLEEEIEEIDNRIDIILNTVAQQTNSFTNNNTGADSVTNNINNFANSSDTSINNLFTSQQMFKDFLNVGYQGLCAITREVISCGQFNNLQAAHIRPRSHGGNYNPSNGILLNRELHWAFDIGCFTILENLTIQVHPAVESAFLQKLDGTYIFIPEIEFFRPAIESLNYHREHIYGAFLNRGRIVNLNTAI